MATFDAHKNFGITTVVTAPTPASSGITLIVTDGSVFPATPFNATVWPASSQPTNSNAEIVRVTNISTNTLTISRSQESTSARSIVAGDQIANTITAKVFTDLEALDTATLVNTTTGTVTALTTPTGNGPLVIYSNNASSLTIQGITAGWDGQRLTIFAIGAGGITIAHQSGSASAPNRIITPSGGTTTLFASGLSSATLIYDGVVARWREILGTTGNLYSTTTSIASLTTFNEGITTATRASTTTIDLTTANNFKVTLDGNISTLTVSGWVASKATVVTIRFTQDATGSRTVAFPAGWLWANGSTPTITATANKTMIVVLYSDDGGTTIFASVFTNAA